MLLIYITVLCSALVFGVVFSAGNDGQGANGLFIVFGPRDYVYNNGAPTPVTNTFSITNPNTTYKLRIINGGLNNQYQRTSSAVITLNGVTVANPNDFNQQPQFIEKTVTLSNQNTLTVELNGSSGSGITIKVIGIDRSLPTISSSFAPQPNAAGWNNGDVTVGFVCADAISGIFSCSSPVTIVTEGANQTVTGIATDRAGNTATLNTTVNLDRTQPAVSITSHANGATLNNRAVTVTGTASDAHSGVASLTCNGTAAIRSGGNFSCDLMLNEGANTIEARAVDLAGNVSSTSIAVSVNTNQGAVTVPDVASLTHLAARNALAQANLQVGTISTANSDTIPAGRVISQTPVAGASIPAGSSVSLVLSLGAAGATPPISFTVDATITPGQQEIRPLSDGATRRLASVTDEHGNQVDFVENELLLLTNDADAVTAFVTRWQGQILRTIDPTGTRLTGLSRMYHVRINTSLADSAAIVADLRAFTPIGQGNHRVTNETGLRLLAATQMENAAGLLVTPNWIFESHAIANRTTEEDTSNSFIGYGNNAFNWPYMNRGSRQDIGVGEAWRALETTGRINNRVSVMVYDGGFDTSNTDFTPNRSLYGQINQAGPASCGGSPCPWHGTAVVEAGMGLPDNHFGVAGPGGPVSNLILVGSPSFDLAELANYLIDASVSLLDGPDIINMSFGFTLPAALSVPPNTALNGISTSFRTAGTLLIASAGNDAMDVDAEDCIPNPFGDDICWEEGATLPCETSEVMCVGGLAWDSNDKAFTPDGDDEDNDPDGGSNYGSQPDDCCTVDIYGPYTLFLGTDPSMTDPNTNLSFRSIGQRNGTSYSAPFVAGVAALVWAANPNLSDGEVEDILINTANTSSTSDVPRWVNAYRAVLEALPNDPPFISINATPGAPCPDDLNQLCISRGADIRFTAIASDPEDVRNVDVEWTSDRDGSLGSGTIVTRNDLSYGVHTITATVTDTTGFTNYDTLTVRVLNDRPPVVEITGPADRAVFQQGQDIILSGRSSDPNNLPAFNLPDSDVYWLLDGSSVPISTGHTATIPNGTITPGVHVVRFVGNDNANNTLFTSTDTISFNITPNGSLPGQPPTVTITNPANNAVVIVSDVGGGRFGADVALIANASDPEDGSILNERFVWTTRVNSGSEETIGTGQTLNVSLFSDGINPVTTQDISVYVTDSDGHIASSSIRIRLTTPDADTDGLTYEQELSFGTDPNNNDTDGDGVWDGAEIVFGTNPTSAASTVTSIPNGVLLGQSGRDILVLNAATGFFGVLGRPTLLGFGMAFDETGTLFIADNERLRIFEPFTNVNTAIGTFGAPDGNTIESAQIAYNPAEHQLYGVELGSAPNSADGQIVRINKVTGAAVRVGTGAGVAVHAIAFRPDGAMFATIRGDATTDRFVRINPATGEIINDIGAVGFPNVYGLAFDLNGVLFASEHISGTQSRLMTIDTATGAGTAGSFVAREMFNLAVMPCAAPCLDQPPVINLPYAARETHVADLNNDSNPDIVTGNGEILMGDGTGNFTLHPTSIELMHGPSAIGDLDLDGDIDVVIGHQNLPPQTLRIYLNDGAANFTQSGGTYTIPGDNSLIVLEIGDITGDGLPDVVARGTFGPSGILPFVLQGLGGGTFGSPNPVFSTASFGRVFTLADMNNDGSLDIVSTGLSGTHIHLNNGSGAFNATQVLGIFFQAYGVAAGDLNGDGYKDIALAVSESRSVGILLSNGNGTFAPVVTRGVGQLFFNVAMSDLTGDGNLDLITSNSPVVTVLNNNSAGGFRLALRSPFSVFNNSAYHVSTGDVDGNGWKDLIVSNVTSITVLLNYDPY